MDILKHHAQSLDQGYRLSCQWEEYGTVEQRAAQQAVIDQVSAEYIKRRQKGESVNVLNDQGDGFVYNDAICYACHHPDCVRNPRVKASTPRIVVRERKWLNRARHDNL